MSTLHTVNKSPSSARRCERLGHVLAGRRVLMIEDGVLGARKGGTFAKAHRRGPRALRRSTRWGPISRRAASKPEDLAEGMKVVGYGGFVDLAASHARVCAWL